MVSVCYMRWYLGVGWPGHIEFDAMAATTWNMNDYTYDFEYGAGAIVLRIVRCVLGTRHAQGVLEVFGCGPRSFSFFVNNINIVLNDLHVYQ